jgi:O-antigen ligase
MEPLVDIPGRRGFWVVGALAVAVGAIALPPDDGVLAWVALGVAVLAVTFALAVVDDGVEYGAAALVASIALKDGVLVVARASVGVFHVVGAALAAVWALRVLRGGSEEAKRLRPSGLELALGALIAAGLWSLPTSLHHTGTLLYTGRLAWLWLVTVLVARSLSTGRARERALVWFVAASVVLSVFALAQVAGLDVGQQTVQGTSLDKELVTRPAGFYLDPNFLGLHLVVASMGALALAFEKRRSWWLVTLIPMLIAVVFTFSRSSWLSLALGLAVCIALAPSRVRLRIGAAVLGAAVVGALVLGPARIVARLASIGDLSAGTSSGTRLLLAQATVDMIRDRPVFGVGLEAFSEAYSRYRRPEAPVDISHPHQVPLTLVAETGVAGALAQAVVLIALAAAVRARMRDGLTETDVAAVGGLAAILLSGLLQYVLYFEVLWLTVGLLAAALRPLRARSEGSAVCATAKADPV